MSILQTIKNKIIDKTSDVMALPARISAGRQIRQANSDTAVLKKDAESGGNYIEPDATNPAWRTRSLANEVRDRYARNAKAAVPPKGGQTGLMMKKEIVTTKVKK